MIQPPEKNPRARTLDDYLGDRGRELQSEVCGLLDVATGRRASARKLEAPIRRWETRARVHPLRGTAWEISLTRLTVALSTASSVLRRVYEAEAQALPLLQTCLRGLRERPSGRERQIPRSILRLLEESAQLRSDSLAAIERSLAVSSQIGAFTTRSSPADVLSLLDDRRRALSEAEACRSRADALTSRAFRLDTNRVLDMESAALKALDTEVRDGPTDGADEETWLRISEDDFSISSGPAAAPRTTRSPAPLIRDPGGDPRKEQATRRERALARLQAAEARLAEATAHRDRALALVEELTVEARASAC